MAFKIKKRQKQKVELISLIDMIFILLVFFLLTSFVIRISFEERGLYVPIPENTVGRAQIMIQFIDEKHVFWLDEDGASIVEEIEENFGYLSSSRLRDRIITELINRNVIPSNQLETRFDQLCTRANENPHTKFFILIRCPNELPYYRAVEVIARISDTAYRNIKYGCVGGTLEQIRQCKNVSTVVERDEEGRSRKNIRIDF